MTAAALAASALPPLAGAPAVGPAPAATVAHDKLPFSHPERQPMRFDLPKAVRHFLRFRKDKEQTSEVFHLFEALPWTGVVDAARAFLATERGQAIYAAEPFLPDLLDDHDALRRMPPGSLAHEYCDYMETEGLSAAGLVHEYDVFRGDRPRLDDQVEWYIDRLRDTHDLLHILTGFGRDTLGEQCLATFVFRQRPSMGHFVLGYAGALVIRTQVKTRAPVLRAAREAQVIGQSCPRICEESILELLAMTTAQVRRKFNLREPRYYNACHRIWREEGIDPQQVLAKG